MDHTWNRDLIKALWHARDWYAPILTVLAIVILGSLLRDMRKR